MSILKGVVAGYKCFIGSEEFLEQHAQALRIHVDKENSEIVEQIEQSIRERAAKDEPLVNDFYDRISVSRHSFSDNPEVPRIGSLTVGLSDRNVDLLIEKHWNAETLRHALKNTHNDGSDIRDAILARIRYYKLAANAVLKEHGKPPENFDPETYNPYTPSYLANSLSQICDFTDKVVREPDPERLHADQWALMNMCVQYHKMAVSLVERSSLYNMKSTVKKERAEEKTAYARRETIRLANEYVKIKPKSSIRSILDFSRYVREHYKSNESETAPSRNTLNKYLQEADIDLKQ